MEEEGNLIRIFVVLCCVLASWVFIHRLKQRNTKGPKTWPILGASIEQLMNYDRMHDWLVEYLAKSRTVVVPMPFMTYTYIADPASVEHVLKTNFSNYPKVMQTNSSFNIPCHGFPDGTEVKAGGMVTYVPYSMGRMEYNWGADAASFNPERWLKDGIFQNTSPFKFTAFQAGPRICLGKDSAYLQMKMALAILCRFYEFKMVPEHTVKYRMMTILSMAEGLKLSVSRRAEVF